MIQPPPPHWMCGRLNAGTSPQIIAERRKWIIAKRTQGHKVKDIAEALGILDSRVSVILHDNGIRTRKLTGCRIRKAEDMGIRLGNMRDALKAMSKEAQDRILSDASKTGRTFAEILAETYEKDMNP